MVQYGWQPRISEQRNYPNVLEHREFIRAYFELHSGLDTITIRQRNKERKSPRLRIYGNRHFLDALTEVLGSQNCLLIFTLLVSNASIKDIMNTLEVRFVI